MQEQELQPQKEQEEKYQYKTEINGIPDSQIWEVDFCSRPLIDDRGKKVWELIILFGSKTKYAAIQIPNNKVNSVELKKVIEEKIFTIEGYKRPKKVIYFRYQLQTIIRRCFSELQIDSKASRRCLNLMDLLEERLEKVYKKDKYYNEEAQTAFNLEIEEPQQIPDNLKAEQWYFTAIPLKNVKQMCQDLQMASGKYGAFLELENFKVDDNTIIPGIVLLYPEDIQYNLTEFYADLEMSSVKNDAQRNRLKLELGANQCYFFGAYPKKKEFQEEAALWEKAKETSKGLHFFVLQKMGDHDGFDGLWLLYDKIPPSV